MTPTARRELGLALVLALVGSGSVLLAMGQIWATVTVAPPGAPSVAVALTGGDLAPLGTALGLVGLAGTVAVLATRGVLRRAVGVVLAAAGLGVIIVAARAPGGATDAVDTAVVPSGGDPTSDTAVAVAGSGWPWIVVVAGGLLLLGGCLVAIRGGHWAAMSARYERGQRGGAPTAPLDDADAVWKALDRGEDPTA